MTTGKGHSPRRLRLAARIAPAAVLALCVSAAASPPPFERMLARALRAREVTGRVILTRSDPFGGPDERESGQLWYLPGRGIRFRTEARGGEDLVLDHDKQVFLMYRAGEKVLYRAPWDRAPARFRQLVSEPERFLDKDLHAIPERRVIQGIARDGYRVLRTSLGDSLPSVSVWIAPDPTTGLPRWITAYSESDSLQVEFRGLSARADANPKDLHLPVPRGTEEQPLDPRELLPGGETR